MSRKLLCTIDTISLLKKQSFETPPVSYAANNSDSSISIEKNNFKGLIATKRSIFGLNITKFSEQGI